MEFTSVKIQLQRQSCHSFKLTLDQIISNITPPPMGISSSSINKELIEDICSIG